MPVMISTAPAQIFTALRDIAPGEEITVNYNGSPEDQSAVWFEVKSP